LAADAARGGIGRRAVGLGEGGAVGGGEDARRAGSDEVAGEEVGPARADVGDADRDVDHDELDAPALGRFGLDGGSVGRDERADEPGLVQRDRDPAALVGVYSEDGHAIIVAGNTSGGPSDQTLPASNASLLATKETDRT
jgi:hypothetical protein